MKKKFILVALVSGLSSNLHATQNPDARAASVKTNLTGLRPPPCNPYQKIDEERQRERRDWKRRQATLCDSVEVTGAKSAGVELPFAEGEARQFVKLSDIDMDGNGTHPQSVEALNSVLSGLRANITVLEMKIAELKCQSTEAKTQMGLASVSASEEQKEASEVEVKQVQQKLSAMTLSGFVKIAGAHPLSNIFGGSPWLSGELEKARKGLPEDVQVVINGLLGMEIDKANVPSFNKEIAKIAGGVTLEWVKGSPQQLRNAMFATMMQAIKVRRDEERKLSEARKVVDEAVGGGSQIDAGKAREAAIVLAVRNKQLEMEIAELIRRLMKAEEK